MYQSCHRFKCKRYFDWSAVSLVGAELKKPWSLMESEGKEKKSLEIILLQSLGGWKAPPQATQDKLFTTVRNLAFLGFQIPVLCNT